MNDTWAACGQADAKPACELGVSASHECRRLLMPHMYEADLVLILPQGFHDAVDTVAGKAKDGVHTPGEKALYEYV